MPREIFDAIQSERCAALRSQLAGFLPRAEERLVLEIGCGNGHFLNAYASAHPEQLCVGIDLRLERVDKALRKCERAALPNLHFLRGDVRNFLPELPAGIRLQDVYLLFPDPWPKKRHHKNRLLQSGFLNEIASRAGQGSRLFFRTDYKPYFDEAREVIAAHPRWRLMAPGPFPFEHTSIFQSRAPTYHSLAAVIAGSDEPERPAERSAGGISEADATSAGSLSGI
jgi:tRNA (guanine-N7-)-methyltransferase